MNKLLIICGPTAMGKTKLGIELAKKFDGEIVSADSRQVYRGMDVGTGKELSVSSKFKVQSSKLQFKVQSLQIGCYEIEGIKIWLLDMVEPDYRFNVADYKRCANAVLADIWKRGKLPIVVGGTGFYVKAITDEIGTINVKPDWVLRSKLSNYPIDQLRITLKELDLGRFQRMNKSDRKNPRRLIRAIEIATKTQISNLKTQSQNLKLKTSNLFIGLIVPNEILYQKIDERVEERVRKGIEKEIKTLLEKGYNWENSALGTTLAYREWKDYFGGRKTKEEVVQRWKFDEHDYARRQFTWFKKDKRINWFDITNNDWQQKVEKRVDNWYIKNSSKFKVQSLK